MLNFFQIGGYSMFSVLFCGLAGLIIALVAIGRPTDARIKLAERIIRAVMFFSIAGYASNMAATFNAVSTRQHEGDGMWMMLFTGSYESTAPVIMGFTFIALIHLALAVAAHRLSRQEP